MGKVGTERVYHKGSGKEQYITISLFTKTKKFEVIDFPGEIETWYASKQTNEASAADKRKTFSGRICAESYNECVAKAKDIYNQYYSLQVRESKVIAYKLQYNKPGNRNMQLGPKYALGIEYDILYRIYVGEEEFLSVKPYELAKMPEEGHRLGEVLMKPTAYSHNWSNFIIIDHTDELEVFFSNLVKGLNDMIDKIQMFFGDGSDHLLSNISNNINLLGSPTNKELE